MGPTAGRDYMSGHLENAHLVDVEHDLTGDASNPAVGGRHPLPPLKQWCRTIGQLGIGPTSPVVLYDDAGGAKAAARAWWMLRAVGHELVWVLDGGLQAAVEDGMPIVADIPTRVPLGPYPASEWMRPHVDIASVERGVAEGSCLLTNSLGPDGRFLPRGELRERFTKVLGDHAVEDVIVSCGSGITACHTLLALEHAGFHGAKLYVGSYSEWSRSGRSVQRS